MKKFIVFPARGFAAIKKYFFLALTLLCIVVVIFVALKINFTPQGAINRNYNGSAYEYQSDAVIGVIEQDTKRSLYIYNTKSGQLAAAVMDKGILGYQMRSISGFISQTGEEKSISFTYRSFFENYTVTWGLTNKDVANIEVGNEKAKLVDYNNGKLWYVCEKSAIKAGEIKFS